MVTLDKSGVLWIVDNKAQFRGIGGANALTGAAYGTYEASLRNFLQNLHPVKTEADAALAALNAGKVKKVVANGFAGEATRFTKGLFDKGLEAFDIRLGKLFTDHATWEAAYKLLELRKGVRLTGRRGTAVLSVNVLAVFAVAELGRYLLTGGIDLRQFALEAGAEIALGTILSRLPAGGIASLALGLESDSPAVAEDRRLDREADELLAKVPNVAELTPQEKADTKAALKSLLKDPVPIPAPPPRPAPPQRYILPGLQNPNWTDTA